MLLEINPEHPEPRKVERVVSALRSGEVIAYPTDTVYGLCADAYRERPCQRLFAAKQRPETMPIQLLAADLDAILDAVPEARGRGAVVARALLPGPYTLILANPARRFRWPREKFCRDCPRRSAASAR